LGAWPCGATDLDGAQGLIDSTDLGNIRLEVAPQSGKPVFVGIARTDELSSYLGDVAHAKVTDFEYEPFEASYDRRGGKGKPDVPPGERIWAASTQGADPQTLTWDVEDGDWSIFVMNADGSAGVQADVSAGPKAPFLTEIGWTAIGRGAILLAAAAGLLGIGPPQPASSDATKLGS
jgi:hypothetical protein